MNFLPEKDDIEIDDYFVKEWIKNQEANSKNKKPPLHWTDIILSDLEFDEKYEVLWNFILKTYKHEFSMITLSILAAGPMETIMSARGKEYIERVEVLARMDPKFRKLLGGVWKSDIPDKIWKRLCAVRGESW